METKYSVLYLESNENKIFSYDELCYEFPKSYISLLNEDYINIISIYNKGKKVAIINKIK